MTNKRVLLLGAETDPGHAAAQALAETGVTLALIAATTEANAAFAVKRLTGKLGAAVSQAIEVGNEAAVRVMLRQVAKALGGLDAVVDATGFSHEHVERLARKELNRTGAGVFIIASSVEDVVAAIDGGAA